MILQYMMTDKKIHEKLLNDVVIHLFKLGPIEIKEEDEYPVKKKSALFVLRLLFERLTKHLRQ